MNTASSHAAAGNEIPAPTGPRSTVPGVIVAFGGVVLAAWVVGGRHLFGIGGDLTPVFAFTLGLVLVVLHLFIGLALVRTAHRGRPTRPATIATLAVAWACGILLGFTIPDITATGLQTILSSLTSSESLDLVVGLSNPLGIIMLAMSVAALVLATGDASGRWQRGSED
ncbi:hypothetical protein [Glaciibacter sp. 2TAF33]|uniref:hypothetical protein n=1 Tax=Glaciibacter sp. 2TAF33 TaxID=3233015 RepID=UPI003F8DA797